MQNAKCKFQIENCQTGLLPVFTFQFAFGFLQIPLLRALRALYVQRIRY
jgi:hypothetical protein